MKFEIYQPTARLKPYIKHFIISENDGEAQTHKVLPGTSLVMGFQYTGKISYLQGAIDTPLATAGITGLLDAYRVFTNQPYTGTLLIVFRETGAAHFIASPLHELFRESLPLYHLFKPADIYQIEEQLSAANNDQQRIAIVEGLLLSHLTNNSADLLVNKALDYIHQSKGTIRIGELAKKLHTSQSPLEKRFRRIVGASPKKFASIVRIKNILSSVNGHGPGFTDLTAGYYDQAHFIKDFKTFTSETPEQYLKALMTVKPPK